MQAVVKVSQDLESNLIRLNRDKSRTSSHAGRNLKEGRRKADIEACFDNWDYEVFSTRLQLDTLGLK